ncbi:carbohydrate esterase family 4 protein [Guyanagaster necrorhizus]|uniref:Carbohydrate esterase family 4 protein n=1 Tax=Guyanagaster necrorhizus TaxID=856835 RepID=A0A9P8AXB2_9AGAR|nr:carbohydrate esterase family 4 protein [Guyanagaster necrorhizus MCA 3950]KAG7451428.1 carbohydrate esterase family 4 protein [Guyanagaster necrorhizus MCA 3950]
MLASVVFAFSLIVFTTAAPHSKRQLAQVISSCTQPNTVALTFDDGPWEYAEVVSDALTSKGAKGTFFYNGNNYECIYDQAEIERVQYVYNAGHQLASHTWSHPDLTTLTWDEIHDQMWRVEQALERIVGVVPAYMRPPYGNYNDLVLEAAYIRGQQVVLWDFDSGDSVGASVQESESTYDSTISQHPSTILALNHETYETTAYDVLPYAIDELQAAGYSLVTLAECLGESPYQSVGSPQVNDGWTC